HTRSKRDWSSDVCSSDLPGLEPAFVQSAAHAVPEAACDRKAMLRGLFLGCGSVNAPSSRYHLEFVAPAASWATAITRLTADVGEIGRASCRERGWVAGGG